MMDNISLHPRGSEVHDSRTHATPNDRLDWVEIRIDKHKDRFSLLILEFRFN